jgi:hypothetical protein
VTYAFLTDGFDLDQIADFDRVLEKGSKAGEKQKAKQERDAVTAAMRYTV